MKLYTILMNFKDRTVGIDQYLANSPEEALLFFIEKSGCLSEYNRDTLLHILKKRKQLLIHLAMNFKGIWVMDFGTDLIDTIEFSDIFGGFIIQSNTKGPKRNI